MSVPVGAILEVVVNGVTANQRMMTVLHWAVVVAPTEQDAIVSQQNCLARLQNGGAQDMITAYRDALSNQYLITTLSAQYIYPTRMRRSSVTINLAGTINSACTAPNVAVFCEKLSILAGRKNRGGIHMPGVPSNGYNGGVVTTTHLTAVSNAADVMKVILTEAAGTGQWGPAILHRTNPFTGTYAAWTTFTTQDTLRTMRRRTVGVGK